MLEKTEQLPLRERLSAIEGVEQAVYDPTSRVVCLILRQNADADAVMTEAESVAGPLVRLEVAFPPDIRERQRVRFIDLTREQHSEHQVSVHVTLEWQGTQHRASVTGERGAAIEMRTAALATLEALDFFIPEDLTLRLAGVKQVRAFDAELIIVSVHKTGANPRNLVGVVVVGPDTLRTVGVAVLSALNRLLGNYLARV